MQQSNNIWIQMNKHEIEAIKRQLLEHDYAGSYGGSINLMQVNNMLDGAMIEILKLQRENEVISAELKKMMPKSKPEEINEG